MPQNYHFQTAEDLAAGSYILYLGGKAFAFEASGTEKHVQFPGRQSELAQWERTGGQAGPGRLTG